MAAPIIELRGVNKSFGPIDVLHDITLKVDAGEVLCLLGDNGAGKSTLIKVLSGVHKPTSGEVLMGGERVAFDVVGSLEQILRGPSTVPDGTMNLVGALRKAMATTGYTEVKEFQRVEVIVG